MSSSEQVYTTLETIQGEQHLVGHVALDAVDRLKVRDPRQVIQLVEQKLTTLRSAIFRALGRMDEG